MENKRLGVFKYVKADLEADSDFEIRLFPPDSANESDFYTIGSFICESDAQEYIAWKNENELKSDKDVIEHDKIFDEAVKEYNNNLKVKIDKDFKDEILRFLNDRINQLKSRYKSLSKTYFKEKISKANQTIKAIESLEEEN